MAQPKRSPWTNVRAAALPATALVVVAFFAGYALFGSNGILAWGEYTKRLDTRRVELAKLEHDHMVLANRVALLDPRHANPDMVDELVRRDLGVAHPDEMVVPLN
jgi:cell division protein FtsB